MIDDFKKAVEESCIVKTESFGVNKEKLVEAVEEIYGALSTEKKVLLFGNGGSAADAQHIAAEFMVRLKENRKAYPAIALTTDTSVITACSNDFSFEKIFARQIEALGKSGDIAIAMSTSGNSPNVVAGAFEAKKKGMTVIGFTGDGGGRLKESADILIEVKSNDARRIQESHITFLHIICTVVENRLLGR